MRLSTLFALDLCKWSTDIASPHLVVTTINSPNRIMKALALGASQAGWRFIAIGDSKSPSEFHLEGCEFLSIDDQLRTGLRFAEKCPLRHYARKNIGYLLSIRNSANLIVETDDDNSPLAAFFSDRQRRLDASCVRSSGWLNVYRYFHDGPIWPRGLPLDALKDEVPPIQTLAIERLDCPIQQGLADINPDVDAVYRLTLPLPVYFRKGGHVALGRGSYCPFNSQNTTWWPDCYPLLYLPAYCSFRMTDIWRSFVAQRIALELGWHVLFHQATVEQERNEHDLMKDFADEVPGYLNNRQILTTLIDLELKSSPDSIPENLLICYEALIKLGVIGSEELSLLEAWLADLQSIRLTRIAACLCDGQSGGL
jgi:hypothetical protein